MALTIRNVVIQELVKDQHKEPQALDLRINTLSNENPIVVSLVEGVSSLYGKRNNAAQYGVFKNINSDIVPNEYLKYVSNSDSTVFLEFSKVVMRELFNAASQKQAQAATGGYLLFVDYSLEQDFFLVAMLKKKGAITVDKNLVPLKLEHLDLSSLHQAARINKIKLIEYLDADVNDRGDRTYLSFVSPAHKKETAGYFVSALGCERGTSSSKATDSLIVDGVHFFRRNADLKPYAEKMKNALVEYMDDRFFNKRPATLHDVIHLAATVIPKEDEEEKESILSDFHDYLNIEKEIPAEFSIDSATFKRLTRVQYRSKRLNISFDNEMLGINDSAAIKYDKSGKVLIIKNLPSELRDAIELVLNERNNLKRDSKK